MLFETFVFGLSFGDCLLCTFWVDVLFGCGLLLSVFWGLVMVWCCVFVVLI